MLPPGYSELVLDTQNLPSDNRKDERELGGCPARKFSMKGRAYHFTFQLCNTGLNLAAAVYIRQCIVMAVASPK
jgi:hypothetical protein